MKKPGSRQHDTSKLAELAEQQLPLKLAAEPDGPLDAEKLLQELQVHQIELESQNEELRRTRAELDSALAQYTTLYDFAPMAYLTLDTESHISQANHAAAHLLDLPRSALYRTCFATLVCPDSRRAFMAFLAKTLEGGQKECDEFTLQLQDRSIIIAIEASTDSNRQHCLAIVTDITRRKQTERELELAATVYKAIGDAIMVADPNNCIIAINPAFTKQTGYTEQEAIGQYTNLLNSGRQDREFYRSLWAALLKTGHWEGELWNKRKNGEHYLEWLRIDTIYDDMGNVRQRVATFSDITKAKQADELVWKQANFDSLTGLPNRNMFHDRLQLAIKQVHRNGLPMALLFLDLDQFKDVNDTLGHDRGDVLLKETAQRLNTCVREIDTVARMGGDEFTIILGELEDLRSIDRIARSILQSLSEPFLIDTETVYLSVSVGITVYPDDTTKIDELLKNADQAMYAAKEAGRNSFRYFTRAMQDTADNRMHIGNDLRSALSDHQFLLNYQPIVELASGAIHKAEALIRWHHPQRGLISPVDFITIAEETGLIVDMGDWVFKETAQQVKHWRTLFDPQFQVSVNKSPVQFRNRKCILVWPEHLLEIGLPGEGIVIEITEGLLMDVSSEVSSKLLGYRDVGIEISLDDFGTGYSSLSYLNKYHIDYLKIDQSFVRNLASGSSDLALCEAIIVMAHKLGIKVIGEGIETAVQRDLLLDAGCDYGQGYFFSKPVAAKEFEKFLWP
jgi:diguanylate cyclase (GGDEF)-like protein/PAS domain S-box-containing protein